MYEILCWMGTLVWFRLEGCLGCGCWFLHGPRLSLSIKHGKLGHPPVRSVELGLTASTHHPGQTCVSLNHGNMERFGRILDNFVQSRVVTVYRRPADFLKCKQDQTRLPLCFKKIGKGEGPHQHDVCSSKAEDRFVNWYVFGLFHSSILCWRNDTKSIQKDTMLSAMGTSTLRQPYVM